MPEYRDPYAPPPIEEQMAYPQFMPYSPSEPLADVTLVTQTNPKHVLEWLEHFYRGEKETSEGVWEQRKKKVFIDGKEQEASMALMNEEGINSFITALASIVNQSVSLSNYNEDEINKIIIRFGAVIRNKIAMQWRRFEIERGNFDTILWTTIFLAHSVLKRAMDEGERKYHKKVIYAPQITRPTPEGKKGGLLGIGNIFKR